MIERVQTVAFRAFAGFGVALTAWILIRSHHIVLLVAAAVVAAIELWPGRAAQDRIRSTAGVALRPFVPAFTIALAFVLRLWWAAHYHVEPTSDYREFHDLALSLANGNVYALGQSKSPATVLFYGIIFRVFGNAPVVMYLTGSALGALQVWLVHTLAARAFASKTPGRLAALAVALSPGLIAYSGLPGSEGVFVTLLLVMILHAMPRREGAAPRRRAVVVAAVLLGVETAALHLTRNTGVVFGAWTAAVALLWMPAGTVRATRLVFAGAFVAATAVCLVPQIAYNVTEYGTFSIQSSRFGALNLLAGTNMESGGRLNRHDAAMAQQGHRGEKQDWREVSRRMREKAIARITRDPAAFLRFALTEKFDVMWCDDGFAAPIALRAPGRDDRSVRDAAARWARWANRYYFVMMALALAGLCAVFAGGSDVRAFVAAAGGILFMTFALHLLIEVQPRYHFVVVFFLPLFAAALVDERPAAATPPAQLPT